MKLLLSLSFYLLLFSCQSDNVSGPGRHTDKMLVQGSAVEATCSGGSGCRACKNCKYCNHCAKKGGTCSVCK